MNLCIANRLMQSLLWRCDVVAFASQYTFKHLRARAQPRMRQTLCGSRSLVRLQREHCQEEITCCARFHFLFLFSRSEPVHDSLCLLPHQHVLFSSLLQVFELFGDIKRSKNSHLSA